MAFRSFLIIAASLGGVACAGCAALLVLLAGPCITLAGEGGEPSLTCVIAARGGGPAAALASVVLLLSASALYLFKPRSGAAR